MPCKSQEKSSDTAESGQTGSSESCLFDHQNRCPLTVAEATADVVYARKRLGEAEKELELAVARRQKRRRQNHRRNRAERAAAFERRMKRKANKSDTDDSDSLEQEGRDIESGVLSPSVEDTGKFGRRLSYTRYHFL